ncbi:MAG: ABC transporter permease [Candidatus Micrarchaeota archaeon]
MSSTKELIVYARKGLGYRKLRSWLTILGVVIGIASIIILIALAQGLDLAIRNQITSFGTNFIQIIPGKLSGGSVSFSGGKGALYQQDADSIKRIPGIIGSTAIVSPGFATYTYKNSTISAILAGVDPNGMKAYVKTIGFEEGGMPNENDNSGVVIGNGVAKKSFKDEVHVGKTLYINEVPFKVVGIFNPSAAMDSDIYVTIHAARQFISDSEDPDRIYAIFIVTDPDKPVAPIAEQVTKIIANNHRLSAENADFTVFTADTILESIGVIFSLLSLFLGSIAFISIIVGAIGIANSMFTSVMERTREIGILKAVGASNSTIVKIFLIEAGVIGAIGGLIGLTIGAVLVYLGAYIAKSAFNTDLPLQITPELAIFALVLSFVVGLAAGYFPARTAAHLQPVEALRYE